MTKIGTLLLLALLLSCGFLVKTSYESRRLFALLDQARAEQRQLDAEFKRLDAEAQAQATHLRVDKMAREKLRMHSPLPTATAYVTDPAASMAVASGASK